MPRHPKPPAPAPIRDHLAADILANDSGLETDHKLSPRTLRANSKRRFVRMNALDHLAEAVDQAPAKNESVHIIAESKWDFWTWVPSILRRWIPSTPHLYCSTWTLNRSNAVELFALWDAGLIGKAHFLTGTYFKRRETAVYAYLLEGIRARDGRFRAFANHAKVLLLANAARGLWLTVEGSANLTSNPRLEQAVLTNSRDVWEFHRAWMEEIYGARDADKPTRNRITATNAVAFIHRRAGDNAHATTNAPSERRRVEIWKAADLENKTTTATMTAALIAAIAERLPQLPAAAVVTVPPQGATWPERYNAARLAEDVAAAIGRPFRLIFDRGGAVRLLDPAAVHLVIDDRIRTGATLRAALAALTAAGVTAYGFAYSGT